MARLIFPEDFLQQQQLLKDIIAQDTATPLVLKTYLLEQGIVLANDNTDGTNAATHEATRQNLSKQAENYNELRDIKFNPLFSHVRGGVQFLKRLYSPQVHKLGDWGITVNGNKIVYPSKFVDLASTTKKFYSVHDGLGGASPLLPYVTENEIDVPADETKIAAAINSDTAANVAEADAEQETTSRDNLWNPVLTHMNGIGQFLLKLYAKNPKKAGDYGFVVDDSPRAPKIQITNLKIGETKTKTSVTLGGTFKNLGGGDLHVYRGKTTSGTPIIVNAGEMLGMTKGFSTITVSNPSTLNPGKFSVLVSK